MAVHPSLQDEAKFSEFHQLYKFDYNDTVWQSSTLFGLTRSDEACLKFIAYGLVLTPTAICGTLGNLLTIIILTRKCMRSPINCLLCGQAFSDLLLCCVSIPLLCFSNIWNFLKLLEIHDGYFSTTAVSTHMHTLYSVAMTCNFFSNFYLLQPRITMYLINRFSVFMSTLFYRRYKFHLPIDGGNHRTVRGRVQSI